MFRDRIKAAYSNLSPSFQRLADYIVDHYYQVAFMTATQLGRHLDVDTATVVRFAQRVGYPGYPDLLSELQSEVKLQLTRYFQPVELQHDDGLNVARSSTRQDATNIEKLALTLDGYTFNRVMQMIEDARRILIIGEDLGEPLADLLARSLRLLGYDAVQLHNTASTIATEFRALDRNRLVIAIAVTAYCPAVTSAVQVANELNAPTIAISGARSWPVAREANVTITCPSTSSTQVPSYTSFMAAINVLLQSLAHKHRDEQALSNMRYNDVLRRLMQKHGRSELDPSQRLVTNISERELSSAAAQPEPTAGTA